MNDEQYRLRYSRQISLAQIGADGQRRQAQARVLIVGAGGLGNPAGMYLASSGIGLITVSDFDTIDTSNLHRQILYRDADVGQPKAAIMAQRLTELNSDLSAVAIEQRLNRAELTAEAGNADVVLDCSDNFRTRWLVNEVCHATATPLVSGAAIRGEGQLAVFPFATTASPCYRCLYSEADENLLDCAGQGVLAPVVGTVGTMMATEALKLLLGQATDLAGKLWVYDGMSGDSRTVGFAAAADCPVCGKPD